MEPPISVGINALVYFKMLRRVFYTSLTNSLKFDFPAVEDYMGFGLQSETFMIKTRVKNC